MNYNTFIFKDFSYAGYGVAEMTGYANHFMEGDNPWANIQATISLRSETRYMLGFQQMTSWVGPNK